MSFDQPPRFRSEKQAMHNGTGLQQLFESTFCQGPHAFECAFTRMQDGHMAPEELTLHSSFGRLYPGEMSNQPTEAQLETLAGTITASDEDPTAPAPAGIAFLGQFIDHDLTLDATTQLGKDNRVPVTGDTGIPNFRSPALDLDSVFGFGPEVSGHLYSRESDPLGPDRLVLGTAKNPLDLQRNMFGRAVIGDPRNDENIYVAQIHGRQFIAEYNRLLDDGEAADYEAAREALTNAYHDRILHEFLPAVVDSSVLDPLCAGYNAGTLPGPIDWAGAPLMPLEFSAAAFRFGHTMIRETYDLNAKVTRFPLFRRVDGNAGGFSEMPWTYNLDLALFFGPDAQKAGKIDRTLPPSLINLPHNVGGDRPNLALRNMQRGQLVFCLPSGETVAKKLGARPISIDFGAAAADFEGKEITPLWYYILAEAEADCHFLDTATESPKESGKLGLVGGTLVAGTLLNIMLRTLGEARVRA